jgi:hypothetical protein
MRVHVRAYSRLSLRDEATKNNQMTKGIWWLASYPRSGNTWLRAFLAALLKVREGLPLDEMRLLGGWEADLAPGPPKERLATQLDLARNHPRRVFLKTHLGRYVVDGAPTLHPLATAGGVYLVRDPRDVALSLTDMRGSPLDETVRSMADDNFWTETPIGGPEIYGSWSSHVLSWKTAPNTLVVRYEDLSSDPLSWFTKIASHLRFDVTEEAIEQAADATTAEKMRREADSPHLEQIPIGPATPGRWETELPAEFVRRIESDHAEQMKAFEYL